MSLKIFIRQNLYISSLILILFFVATVTNGAPARSNCTSTKEAIIDFETLEKEIRKTSAIGVLAKLKLSNDINRLLKEIKDFHQGNSSLTLEQQREHYDLLYMKVVSLIEGKDPELFHQLCNAWDPIWVALQDEDNLNKISRSSIPAYFQSTLRNSVSRFISSIISSSNAEDKHAQESLSHEDVVKSDLFIVITLHGWHCESVTSYEKLADQDYIVHCKSGDQFRTFVSEEGRVNVLQVKSQE